MRYRPPSATVSAPAGATVRSVAATLSVRPSAEPVAQRYRPPAPEGDPKGPTPLEELTRQQAAVKAERERLAQQRQQTEQVAKRYAERLSEVVAAVEKAERVLAADAVAVGLRVAEVVLGRAYATDSKALTELVHGALRRVPDHANTKVKVCAEDLPRVELVLAGTKRAAVEVLADPSLGPGDCLVESPGVVIDARLRERIAAIATTLQDAIAPDSALPTHDEVSLDDVDDADPDPAPAPAPTRDIAGGPDDISLDDAEVM